MPDQLGDPPLPYARIDHSHTVNVETEPVPDGPSEPRGAGTLRTLGIIALILGIILMLGALYTSVQTWRILNAIDDRITTVDTGNIGPTGCPAGEGQCGG